LIEVQSLDGGAVLVFVHLASVASETSKFRVFRHNRTTDARNGSDAAPVSISKGRRGSK
jgi:hypothetical protein